MPLKSVPDESADFTGYIVASFDGREVKTVANFRHKAHADKFVTMLRMAGHKPDVGVCICESKAPIWSPLDKGLPQPPPAKEPSRIITP